MHIIKEDVLYHALFYIANSSIEIEDIVMLYLLLLILSFLYAVMKSNFLFFLLLFVSASTFSQDVESYPKSLLMALGGVDDFTSHGTQPHLSFDIESSSNCGDCHGGFTAMASDDTYMPFPTWAGSMMANATRDPLFWAAVDIANNDLPGVGDFCIRCHTPTGFYAGHTKDATGNMSYANGCELTGTVISSESKLNDYQGVTCHFCHRQEAKGPANEPIIQENSNVWLDDTECDNPDSTSFGPCRKGPYTQPLSIPHEWEYSSFVKQGEFCGSCHNVSSPEILNNGVLTIAKTLIDETGVDTGLAMPIERTFSEWKQSLYSDSFFQESFETTIENTSINTTCQDCHMPQATDPNARACSFNNAGARFGDLKTHEFAGGNSWMPLVLRNQYGAGLDNSGSLSRTDAFNRTIVSALDMLQNKSATIELSVISSTPTQGQVNVKVTNLTGHKLPTGYPEGRRMWINLQVKDAGDNMIFESGAYDIATAELTEAGAKVYEAQQGQWDAMGNTCVFEVAGNKQFHFALNNCILKDNRIPPLGFLGGNDIETKPVGIVYPARPGFPNQTVNFDETLYNFTIPMGTPLPLTITATLKYQTASKDYIEFLDNESTNNMIPSENTLCNRSQTVGPANQSRSAFMKTLWENNGKSAPVDMVSSTIQISE